jgi:DNA repair photolyase
MNYWNWKKQAMSIIPRKSKFRFPGTDKVKQKLVKEKGRKSNYKQYNLIEEKFQKIERLLDKEKITSFLEVSLRAQSCPMPLNIDVWDGMKCPFGCRYCYADYFKASLYSSFFDKVHEMGLRHCDPDYYKKELDKLMKYRNSGAEFLDPLKNAIGIGVPLRFGIRFEDFLMVEKRKHISLELLKYLSEQNYPIMINTKSDIFEDEEYLKVLSDNKGKTAIHVTLISADEKILKRLEPGAPSLQRRLNAMKALIDNGIRVVARIEPYMVGINDLEPLMYEYMKLIKKAGVRHITFDGYSYSAGSIGIKNNFEQTGYDFDRMYLLSCDSQWFGSFMLGKFMKEFRKKGFKCSTFDFGNVPNNDNAICCEVGDWFENFSWGCGVGALRFISGRKGKETRWKDFEKFVFKKGGFLSEEIKREVKQIWNLDGNPAWFLDWAYGLEAIGIDKDGIVWKFDKNAYDFRKNLMENTI